MRSVAYRCSRVGCLDSRELLSNRALGLAERVQPELKHVVGSERAYPRYHTLFEHLLHFGGYAGQEIKDRFSDSHTETGRSANGIRQNLSPFGEVGLLQVRRAHRATGFLETPPDVIEGRVISHEPDPQRCR